MEQPSHQPEGPAPLFANTDGIITSNTTTIAINKLSDSFPRPTSNTTAATAAASAVSRAAASSSSALATHPQITVHSLPRMNSLKSSDPSLDAIGDSLAGLRLRPCQAIMKSGRMSAEPTPIKRSESYRLSAALNALDLDNLDFRSIDPVLASKLLDEIRSGADIGPLLEKLKDTTKQQKETKMVTFEDDLQGLKGKLNPDDVFM